MLSNYTLYVQLLITHLYFLYLSFYSLSFSFCSSSMKRSLVVRDASNPHLPLFQLHNKPVLRATCKHPMVQVRNVYQLYQLVKEENFPGYDNGKQENDEKLTNNSFPFFRDGRLLNLGSPRGGVSLENEKTPQYTRSTLLGTSLSSLIKLNKL